MKVRQMIRPGHLLGAWILTMLPSCAEAIDPSPPGDRPGETAPAPRTVAQPLVEDSTGPASKPTSKSAAPSVARQAPHPLSGVSSIVEADIAKVWNEVDEKLGPRTFVELSNVVVHAGRPPSTKVFSQLGGPDSEGRLVQVKELPTFTQGARYVLFFGKEASVYTPIWARLAFRIEKVNKKSIVLGPDGTAVTRFGVEGVQFGGTRLVTPNTELSKGLKAEAFAADKAAAAPELSRAVAAADFVAAAVEATLEVGGPLGETFTLAPKSDVRWDQSPTAP